MNGNIDPDCLDIALRAFGAGSAKELDAIVIDESDVAIGNILLSLANSLTS